MSAFPELRDLCEGHDANNVRTMYAPSISLQCFPDCPFARMVPKSAVFMTTVNIMMVRASIFVRSLLLLLLIQPYHPLLYNVNSAK